MTRYEQFIDYLDSLFEEFSSDKKDEIGAFFFAHINHEYENCGHAINGEVNEIIDMLCNAFDNCEGFIDIVKKSVEIWDSHNNKTRIITEA